MIVLVYGILSLFYEGRLFSISLSSISLSKLNVPFIILTKVWLFICYFNGFVDSSVKGATVFLRWNKSRFCYQPSQFLRSYVYPRRGFFIFSLLFSLEPRACTRRFFFECCPVVAPYLDLSVARPVHTGEFADSTAEPNVAVRPTTATFSFYANFVNTLFSRLSYFASMPHLSSCISPICRTGRRTKRNIPGERR